MKKLTAVVGCMLMAAPVVYGQAAAADVSGSELKYVVTFSRHGVRSPTGKAAQYDKFSSGTWPEWSVKPGYLTEHGFHLMELFGGYDRTELSKAGLLSAQGCGDAGKVTFYADSDERTQETGKALAKGMFPGCAVAVGGLPEGTNDGLFHASPSTLAKADSALALAAIGGRIGGNPDGVTEAHRALLAALDEVLICGKDAAKTGKRTSLFEIPATLAGGQGDHLAELRGPLNTASTLSENILLEYTEGMDAAKVGWGCVDGTKLRTLIGLHTAAVDFGQRTPAIATVQASNLVEHIYKAMQQSVEQRAVVGAPGKVTDRALFLVGHDTNLENMAGMLGLTWIADGRRDDTPPGSAFVFEVWKKHGETEVRVFFTAQTLEQMRSAKVLTGDEKPVRVPVFVPGCSRADMSCSWDGFSKMVNTAVDMRFVEK